MELSPEERQRIYLEEKARLEARRELSEEKKPKKSGRLKWLLLIFFGLVVLGSMLNEKPSQGPKINPLSLVTMDFKWHKDGFDNIMMGDFTIQNKNTFDVKDIEVTCTHFGKSGTPIDSNTRTIYEIVKTNSKKTFKDFNMGFIHSQAHSSSCKLTDVKVAG